MTDPKKPETDATMVIKDEESSGGRSDEPRKDAEDQGLETYIASPSKPEPPGSDPEGRAPVEPPPLRAAEKNAGNEPVPKGPVGRPPGPPPIQQKAVPAKKKGGGAGLVLCIVLLLAIGAGVFLFMRQSNQGSGWTRWLPFKSGAGQQQEPAQNAPAGIQGTLSGPSPKHEWVQAGMPSQTVRDIMGQPLRVGAAGQMLQWEYDTGTELFIVRFQDDKVYDKGLTPYPSTVDSRAAQTPSTSSSAQVSQPPQTTQTAQTAPAAQIVPTPQVAPATQTAPASADPGVGAGTASVSTSPQQNSSAPRYDRIQLGMTSEAVRGILGGPVDVKKVGRAIEWEYDTGTGYFEVRFRRNKVVYKGMSTYHTPKTAQPSSPAASPQPAGVAPAPLDYGKITVGMTPEAVTQILGNPAQVKKLRISIEWEYETPQGTFEVRFRNNRVSWRGMAASHPAGTGTPAAPASGSPGGGSSPLGGGSAN